MRVKIFALLLLISNPVSAQTIKPYLAGEEGKSFMRQQEEQAQQDRMRQLEEKERRYEAIKERELQNANEKNQNAWRERSKPNF